MNRFSSIGQVFGAATLGFSLMSGAVASDKSEVLDTNGTFQIPQGSGKIVASHKGTSGKNILYILDHHATGNGGDEAISGLDPVGIATQKSIFQILDYLIKERGSIHLTQEAWSSKKGESQSDFIKRNLAGFMLSPGLSNGGVRSLDGGYTMAMKLAGNSRHQATNLIAAVYGTKVTNIAPMDTRKELEVMKTDIKITVLKSIISSPELTCGDIGSKPENLLLFDAVSGLENPKRSNPCGCGIMTTYSENFNEWAKSRYVDAAMREIDTMSESNGKNLVVVAGGGHVYHAMKRMKEKGIGYQVVIPTGAEASRIDLIQEPVQAENQRLKSTLACLPAHTKKIPIFQEVFKMKVEDVMTRTQSLLKGIEK